MHIAARLTIFQEFFLRDTCSAFTSEPFGRNRVVQLDRQTLVFMYVNFTVTCKTYQRISCLLLASVTTFCLYQNVVDAEIKKLLELKAQFKKLTGTEFPTASGRTANKKEKAAVTKKQAEAPVSC
jgi:hypothetical protein